MREIEVSRLSSKADNFFEYCVSVAKEFESRMSRMRVFVQHNLSTGTANEVILREFLSKHAVSTPKNRTIEK